MIQVVIDASVARSTGADQATDYRSASCRMVLSVIRKQKQYYVLMTDAIIEEWLKHESSSAKSWLTYMSSKDRVIVISKSVNERFRNRVKHHAPPNKLHIMLKDCHLLEACFIGNNIVISLDEEVRGLYASICDKIPQLKQVLWANPNQEPIIPWLQTGAEQHPDFILCEFAS